MFKVLGREIGFGTFYLTTSMPEMKVSSIVVQLKRFGRMPPII